jgi:hypothetical protein
MSKDPHHATHPHGHFEHRDIGVSTVVYFLVGLAVALIVSFFVVAGIYRFLTHRFEAQQPAVSPLVAHAPVDTRKLPDDDYEKYLHKNFPEPQLETNERTELNKIRLHEEETLSTYDYLDKSAGTVRIPIDRAMDLLVQRGLPVRAPAADESKSQQQAKKEPK